AVVTFRADAVRWVVGMRPGILRISPCTRSSRSLRTDPGRAAAPLVAGRGRVGVNSWLICATFSLSECAICWGTVSARVHPTCGGKESAYSHGTHLPERTPSWLLRRAPPAPARHCTTSGCEPPGPV